MTRRQRRIEAAEAKKKNKKGRKASGRKTSGKKASDSNGPSNLGGNPGGNPSNPRRLTKEAVFYFLGFMALLDLALFLFFHFVLDSCYGLLCLI